MQYQIIRTNRRSVALIIDRRGNLVVRAPKFAAQSEIERFIKLKQRWIEKHQLAFKNREDRKKIYIDGEKFYFLGKDYILRLVDSPSPRLIFKQGEFVLSKFQQHKASKLFEDWYRQQAKVLIGQRANFWQSKMGVVYKKLSITGANTRWGSCSGKGSINFSWRLVLASLDVVDYVVVHELAHLEHHNHSGKFWFLVGQYAPNYKQAKKWLNLNGNLLIL
jgi:hypothetical protein